MEVLTTVDPGRIGALLERDEFFWLDLHSPSAPDLATVGDLLGLHPLAVEDSREWYQRPKVESYDDHVLLVYFTALLREVADDESVVPIEVHIYVAGGYVLTLRRDEIPELEALRDDLEPAAGETEDYVVYRILDTLTDRIPPIVEQIGHRIDDLEDVVLERVRPRQLTRIYRLKQDVQTLKRLIVPEREAMETASAEIVRLPGLTSGTHAYLRDVVDHLRALQSNLERHTTDLNALVDTFFNANANRLNQQVTRLTVIATFFLVWTLVTSFFGQNFRWLTDNVSSKQDFLLYGVGGLVVPTVLLAAVFWWRRDDWWQ